MIPPREVPVGEPITFSGYADDYGKHIVAIEFSLDGGAHWTSYDVSSSVDELWVHWSFIYTPKKTGTYNLLVRSKRADGKTSPLPDVATFTAV